MDAFIKSMSLRIDGGYKKTATISDEQKIYELSQIWKAAENPEHDSFYNVSIFVDYSTQEPEVSFDIVW